MWLEQRGAALEHLEQAPVARGDPLPELVEQPGGAADVQACAPARRAR